MKVCLFNQGQFGDLIMDVAAAKTYKEKFPDHELFVNVAQKYKAIVPLLENNKHIDGIQLWENYENWPSESDQKIIHSGIYDKVGHPMMPHLQNDWYRFRHQTVECAYQNGVIGLDEANEMGGIQIELEKWFNIPDFGEYVALQPFAGWYAPNNIKRLSVEKAQSIANAIVKSGYKVLQIGGADEPKLDGCEKYDTSALDSVRNMLGCKCLVHTDSFIGWAASGYQFPQIGLYNYNYYSKDFVKNIQPVNPNSQYFSVDKMDDIREDDVLEAVNGI